MSDQGASSALPITVLTGFLGSGKTTLLNALLAHPEAQNTAVLINELGEIGLDHLLAKRVDENTVLLDSGCLCCTVRGDLIDALRDLFLKRVKGETPEFERVLVETTGLADPAPILHTLMSDPLIGARYRFDGIVATVDAVHAENQFDTQPESVKQAAMADRIVLTKSDLAGIETTARAVARLHRLNPAAPILDAPFGAVTPDQILNAGLFNPAKKIPDVAAWLKAEAYGGEHHHHHHHHAPDEHCDHCHGHDGAYRHDARISAFALTYSAPLVWESLVSGLQLLIATQGANLLRIKGILNLKGEEQPVAVHGVQHLFHPPAPLPAWPDADRRSRLVFITRDLGRSAIEAVLTAALGYHPDNNMTD